MALKIATRSSTIDLEKEIDEFAIKSGQNKSEIYRRAHVLYLANEARKLLKRGE